MSEPSAEFINRFIQHFNDVKDKPIPKGERITVYCEKDDEEGFAYNVLREEMGIEVFIARKWIKQSVLDDLMETTKKRESHV